MTDRGWKRAFEDPIPLPRGRQLVALKDAADYITRLPKADHESQQWQAAIEALIMAAEGRGPLMHARIGVMRALNRHVERVFNPDRKDHHWGRPEAGSGSVKPTQLKHRQSAVAPGSGWRASRFTAISTVAPTTSPSKNGLG